MKSFSVFGKVTVLAVLFIFCFGAVNAQDITGRIVNGEKMPISFANVILQRGDSSIVQISMSNESGAFKLQRVQAGDYKLTLSNLGYENIVVDLRGYKENKNLGTLIMHEAAQQLEAVTVSVANVEGDAGKQIAFPNQRQVNASANGVDLLKKLMLPQLKINALDNSISSSDGGSVQLCINGKKASQQEISALQPSDIVRIELEENPGVRYGNADIMVNYIVRRYDSGGSFSYDGMQSTKSLFGRNNLTAKFNNRKSEFALHYGTNQQFFNDMWSERTELFNFSDGKQYHREQITYPYKTKWFQHWGYLNYNLQQANNYLLYITASFSQDIKPDQTQEGELFTQEYPEHVTEREDISEQMNISPSLDIYFEKKLRNKQTLVFNAVGTYINTDNSSSYKEYLNNEAIVDYSSTVEGAKYSLITEALYEKRFNKGGKLTTGVKHTQSYTNNIYDGTLMYNTQMRQANSYGYAQFQSKVGKLSYRLGLGVNRAWFRQAENDAYETWTLNPQVNLSYKFNKSFSASLNGGISTENPTLSELSAASQLVDSLQINRGNPSLKPYDYYYSTLRLNYNKGKVNIGFYNRYRYRKDVIMDYVYRETYANGSEKFIHSYANSPYFQQWKAGIDVRIGMLWDILQLSAGVDNNRYWSKGVNYNHVINSIGFNAEAALMYKSFTFMANYQLNSDTFWGEDLNTGESLHLLTAQYKIKNVLVGLNLLNPFKSDYYRNEDNLDQFAGYTYRYHINDAARMICINLAWNFSFGREYKKAGKRMDNSDKDSGVL